MAYLRVGVWLGFLGVRGALHRDYEQRHNGDFFFPQLFLGDRCQCSEALARFMPRQPGALVVLDMFA